MAKVQAKTRQASMRRAFGSQEQTFLGRHQNRGQTGEGNRPYPPIFAPFRDEPRLLEEIFKTHCLHPSFEKVLKLAQKAPV